MPFVDPTATQNPTTNLVADDAWGDAVNLYQNDLRGAKAGCLVSTVAGTAIAGTTIIPFATEVYDNQACHGATTSRITVPSGWDGLWFLGTNIRCTSGQFIVYLVLNGDTTNGLLWAGSSNAYQAGDDSKTTISTIYPLVAGDYVEVGVAGGTAIYTTDASYFWGQWMHSP